MIVAYLLMGFAFLVILVVLPLQFFYGEERVKGRLASLLDMTESDDDWHLALTYHWQGQNKARVLHVGYSVNLGVGPVEHLCLRREGASSGSQARHGVREVTTGDRDFDDFFWVELANRDYLTQERRDYLLDVFQKLPADAHIEYGCLKGSVRCEQSPFGPHAVARVVRLAKEVRGKLAKPPGPKLEGPALGWVASGQAKAAGDKLLVAGVGALLCGVLWLWLTTATVRDASFWVRGCLPLTGLLLVATGIGVRRRHPLTVKLARCSFVVAAANLLMTLPLWLQSPKGAWMGGLVGLLFVGQAIYHLHRGWMAISRIRLT